MEDRSRGANLAAALRHGPSTPRKDWDKNKTVRTHLTTSYTTSSVHPVSRRAGFDMLTRDDV